MGRVAQLTKVKLIGVAIPLIVVVVGIVGAINSYNASPKAQVVTQSSKTTDVKYKGVQGQTALALLKKYENVQTKKYSFGELVTSINGTQGTGPKYWTFYANGKMSDVGASDYKTKINDNIEWKLQ